MGGDRMDGSNADDRIRLGQRIDLARKAQGLSYVMLAQRTGYDERTIRNVTKGQPTRVSTVSEICQALNISPNGPIETNSDILVSDDDHGSYSFTQCDDYIGYYYATRRSFSIRGNLVRSIYELFWSNKRNCLCFKEIQKFTSEKFGKVIDFSQSGEVYISKNTGLFHFQTVSDGAIRLITLTRLRMDDKTMNGIVLTQSPESFYYKPSISPIFLQKADATCTLEELAEGVRSMSPDETEHKYANEYLMEIERNIGLFATGDMPSDRRRS